MLDDKNITFNITYISDVNISKSVAVSIQEKFCDLKQKISSLFNLESFLLLIENKDYSNLNAEKLGEVFDGKKEEINVKVIEKKKLDLSGCMCKLHSKPYKYLCKLCINRPFCEECIKFHIKTHISTEKKKNQSLYVKRLKIDFDPLEIMKNSLKYIKYGESAYSVNFSEFQENENNAKNCEKDNNNNSNNNNNNNLSVSLNNSNKIEFDLDIDMENDFNTTNNIDNVNNTNNNTNNNINLNNTSNSIMDISNLLSLLPTQNSTLNSQIEKIYATINEVLLLHVSNNMLNSESLGNIEENIIDNGVYSIYNLYEEINNNKKIPNISNFFEKKMDNMEKYIRDKYNNIFEEYEQINNLYETKIYWEIEGFYSKITSLISSTLSSISSLKNTIKKFNEKISQKIDFSAQKKEFILNNCLNPLEKLSNIEIKDNKSQDFFFCDYDINLDFNSRNKLEVCKRINNANVTKTLALYSITRHNISNVELAVPDAETQQNLELYKILPENESEECEKYVYYNAHFSPISDLKFYYNKSYSQNFLLTNSINEGILKLWFLNDFPIINTMIFDFRVEKICPNFDENFDNENNINNSIYNNNNSNICIDNNNNSKNVSNGKNSKSLNEYNNSYNNNTKTKTIINSSNTFDTQNNSKEKIIYKGIFSNIYELFFTKNGSDFKIITGNYNERLCIYDKYNNLEKVVINSKIWRYNNVSGVYINGTSNVIMIGQPKIEVYVYEKDDIKRYGDISSPNSEYTCADVHRINGKFYLFAGDSEGTLRMFRYKTGELLIKFQIPYKSKIPCMSVINAEKIFLSADENIHICNIDMSKYSINLEFSYKFKKGHFNNIGKIKYKNENYIICSSLHGNKFVVWKIK